MFYVPQSIAVHTNRERQNFRRGECGAYGNPVLRDAPNFDMPNFFVKRLTSGEAPTVKLYRLTDDFISTLTPASVVDYPLDSTGEYEMMVIEGGNWTGLVPSDIIGTYCYLIFETASQNYYTDEFLVMANDDGFPTDCGANWVKLSWKLNGSCIVSGKTSTNQAEPVHGYPETDYWHRVYWAANLSRPEWEYDEKGEEDAHGVLDIDTRKLVKRWTLEGEPLTESLYDAITTAALADEITIEYSDGTVFENVRDIRTEVAWEGGGCRASVSMKFSTDYFVKQGCC